MGKTRRLAWFGYATIFILVSILVFSPNVIHGADNNIWHVRDVITPSLDQVKWFEEGGTAEAPTWITDGSWYQASMTQSLVGPNDIFVSTYEKFNWQLISSTAQSIYGLTFNSFSDFENNIANNPGPWLKMSWQVDPDWYGVSLNTSKVIADYNDTTSTGELWTWFHITRIPEYLVGQGNLESWLTGFDLTPVSTGSLKLWELYKDYSTNGIYYTLRFEAPADIMSQEADNYTCTIPVSPTYQGNTFSIQQNININMPANTVIKATSPSDLSIQKDNNATFMISQGSVYPTSFIVVSGSPTKSFNQEISDGASIWLTTPSGWAAILSLIVISFTGLRGRRIWRRNKLYHRFYKSMITLYDLYNKDLQRFNQEIDIISNSIFKMVVEDKINDEQFEKLLKRRDDLLQRANTHQLLPPKP